MERGLAIVLKGGQRRTVRTGPALPRKDRKGDIFISIDLLNKLRRRLAKALPARGGVWLVP